MEAEQGERIFLHTVLRFFWKKVRFDKIFLQHLTNEMSEGIL